MNDRFELTEDRIDDLEDSIIKLAQDIDKQKKSRQPNKRKWLSRSLVIVTTVPIVITMFFLLGLDVNYQSGNKTVNYSSKGLIEVTLLVVTTFSGSYMANKHRN